MPRLLASALLVVLASGASLKAAPSELPPSCAAASPQTQAGSSGPPAAPDAEVAVETRCVSERVTVTAFRESALIEETPASVALVTSDALAVTASPFVDDALRQVVGFSLFRRTGSRTANPTTQGVSLRGLGASGASRALVLSDGLPLNDPFGSWVYWSRQPRLSVDRIEVLRGGAADLYGSGALGGVIQVLTRGPREGRRLEAEAVAGQASTFEGGVTARTNGDGDWAGRFSAEGYTTDGYVPVPEASRGAVDTEAASRRLSLDALVERRAFGEGRVSFRLQGYGEDRENGTPLQTNDTRLGLAAVGLDAGGGASARTSVRLWGQTQLYHQSFSAVSADRTREDLTRTQAVPARALGLKAQWARAIGSRQQLLLGADARHVSGHTEETGYAGGAATSTLDAGAQETGGALFAQDLLQLGPRLLATASLRLDAWTLRDARTITTPLATGVAATTTHPDRDEAALSPRLGIVFRAKGGLSLTAAGYGAFRAPTLNELYRSFRVGDSLTLANPELEPERLWGGEAGALVSAGRHSLRLSAFTSEVEDAVANVTVASTPALITRQRQNVGRARSRGIEAELDLRVGRRGVVTAGYAFTDATVTSFPADPALEGNQLPQVPRHQGTLQARYDGRLRLGLQLRATSDAWEDDRNSLALDAAYQLDLFAGYSVSETLLLFAAAENLTDAEIVAGRMPVPTLAAPRQLRAGLRLTR